MLLTRTLSVWTQFTSTTIGRDKLYRTVQYLCRFLAYYMVKLGMTEWGKKANQLSIAVGMGRKRTNYFPMNI